MMFKICHTSNIHLISTLSPSIVILMILVVYMIVVIEMLLLIIVVPFSISTIGKFDQQRLLEALVGSAVELFYNLLALVSRFHSVYEERERERGS